MVVVYTRRAAAVYGLGNQQLAMGAICLHNYASLRVDQAEGAKVVK